MAESRSKANEAAALLRRAASILSEGSGSSSQSVVNTTAEPQTQPLAQYQQTPTPTASTNASMNHEEFRRLFAPYHRANNTNLVQQPAAKRSRSNFGSQNRYFKPKDTWTHDFLCLASPLRQCVPTRAEKLRLQNAGLGRKRISFHKNDGAS